MSAVTIGIPFFNPGAHFKKALQSIFAQTHRAWELILVDDGSTDGSLELARRIRDPRVLVLSDGRSVGLTHRLNQLVRVSRTEFFCRMDADDIMHPERLERQVDALRHRPSAAFVGSAAYVIDDADQVIGTRTPRETRRPVESLIRVPVIHPTVVGRTAWFRQHAYDARFPRAEDLELWCRTWPHRESWNLDPLLLFYRDAPSRDPRPTLRTYASARKVIREHGPDRIGRVATELLCAREGMKEAMLKAASAVGASSAVMARRNGRTRPEEWTEAQAVLGAIFATTVPGIPGDDPHG